MVTFFCSRNNGSLWWGSNWHVAS